ncbi:MAG: hypothetical protein C0412_18845, partial [Flavobacterium sp.]|nr:hypothetical protein [Flavobacterium sp.]
EDSVKTKWVGCPENKEGGGHHDRFPLEIMDKKILKDWLSYLTPKTCHICEKKLEQYVDLKGRTWLMCPERLKDPKYHYVTINLIYSSAKE